MMLTTISTARIVKSEIRPNPCSFNGTTFDKRFPRATSALLGGDER